MMRLLRVTTAAALLASTILVASTYAAELTASSSSRAVMDPTACQQLKADVLGSGTPDAIKQQVKGAGDGDCWTRTSSSWSPVAAFGVTVAAASAGCGSYYAQFGVGILFLEVATSHTNVGLCRDGTKITQVQWENCYVSTIPLYFGGIDWCGVYWPSPTHTVAEPGNNFWVAAYSAPWYHRFGWMRFDVRGSDGSSYNLRGGCCN